MGVIEANEPAGKLIEPVGVVFVYNADGGIFNSISDALHKALSPRTYACHLCRLTHGTFRMHRAWRAFVSELGHPTRFYHRDEFYRVFGPSVEGLPAVFIQLGSRLQCVLPREEILACQSSTELMERLRRGLASHAQKTSDSI